MIYQVKPEFTPGIYSLNNFGTISSSKVLFNNGYTM